MDKLDGWSSSLREDTHDTDANATQTAAKWQFRRNAMESLATSCRPEEELLLCTALLSFRSKESSFNVAKPTIVLFSAWCKMHARHIANFPAWASKAGATLEKISDRKLAYSIIDAVA